MRLLISTWLLQLIGITWAVSVINQGWNKAILLLWFVQFLALSLFYLQKQISALAYNRHPETSVKYQTLGAGTVVTIFRGYLIVLLSGFILHTVFPITTEPWFAWLPGLFFIIASAADYLDGYLARRTGHTSEMGERLEHLVDTAALVIAPILAVLLNRLPLWYLIILLMQITSKLVVHYWTRTGKKTYPVPARPQARVVAGFQMGFVGVALLPFLPAFALTAASVAVVVVSSWEFILDITYVTGRPPKMAGPYAQIFAAIKAAVRILAYISLPAALFLGEANIPGWLLIAGLPVLLGFLPRLSAVVVAVLLGIAGPATFSTACSILLFSLVFMLGPGKPVLWDGEEQLLMKKIGGD